MQFKHPELLYALLLLLIPIIVHLFQLRRFKEVPFTNVAFLKEVSMQTRKSSQLKKWLTLIARLLLIACAVLAFAQPYTSKTNALNKSKETVIYLDNSFSMQAKGTKGELLRRAIQDIINDFPEDEELTLFTNTETYRNTTIKAIKNDLLKTSYSSNQIGYDAIQLKASKFFNKDLKTIKNLILVSDFQQKNTPLNLLKDSTITTNLTQLKPVKNSNLYIDNASVSRVDSNTMKLEVELKNTGATITNLPVSLFDGENLIAKTSINMDYSAKTHFNLSTDKAIDGRLVINDNQLQFDNELFFNINTVEKIKVLAINDSEDDTYLKKIYTKDEFEYRSHKFNQLNYSDISSQNLIILNELKSIPNALITAINNYSSNGGLVVIIPSIKSSLNTYNQLLNDFNLLKFNALSKQEKLITNINYSHPLYSGVFDKKTDNFQYPKVNTLFKLNSTNGSTILKYQDNTAFLQKNGNAYIFTASISTKNSNFKNSPLIVPTLYNIARQSLKLPNIYYTIGESNSYDVNTTLQQDMVVKLHKDNIKIIPQQEPSSTKIRLITEETPSISGIYDITNANTLVSKVSYNYNREESDLSYLDLDKTHSEYLTNSVSKILEDIKSNSKINELWKWFVIFALLFLILEILILKYFK